MPCLLRVPSRAVLSALRERAAQLLWHLEAPVASSTSLTSTARRLAEAITPWTATG